MKYNIWLIPISLSVLSLAGCFDGDDDYNRDRDGMKNATPVAVAGSFTTQADIPVTETLSGTDADGDKLSYAVASEPAHGTVMVENDGSFTYSPASTFTGQDQFTFTVSDGQVTSTEATVDITVDAQQVSFNSYSRDAYQQESTAEPLPVNGREFDQDVTDPAAYDDLLMN
jgi:hypothetical protein